MNMGFFPRMIRMKKKHKKGYTAMMRKVFSALWSWITFHPNFVRIVANLKSPLRAACPDCLNGRT